MIWVEGVALAPAVGACGMWKEEEDGGCRGFVTADVLVKGLSRGAIATV